MGRLTELQVERVDAVDRPATGHRWVVIKSEDGEETVTKTVDAARTVLEALIKEEGLTLSDDTVEALKALATLLDVSFEVAEKSDEDEGEEPEAPEADGDEPEADADEGEEPAEEPAEEEDAEEAPEADGEEPEVEKADDDEPLTRATLGPALKEALAELAKDTGNEPVSGEGVSILTVRKARSKQPTDADAAVEKGGQGGVDYSNIVFGQ